MTKRNVPSQDRSRPRRVSTRMFATCMPGLAPLVSRELGELAGVTVTGTGNDGRSDVVFFEADAGGRRAALASRTADDVFVEIGHTLRSSGDNPRWMAGRLWKGERVETALSVWAEHVKPRSRSMTFRVIARVLQERLFLRSELRRELVRTIRAGKPKWTLADPAQIEVWVIEARHGRLVAGLRLSDALMRQHGGREVEQPGALRPAVAAAMVGLAGEASGTLFDPCCGTGTILAEALAAGWKAAGADISPAAVQAARQNAPHASVRTGDARKIELPDGAVAACVSNPPFGRQFRVQGEMVVWWRTVLKEMARVTRAGGRVILLAPELSRALVPGDLKMREKFSIRLLGMKTTIWVYDRS